MDSLETYILSLWPGIGQGLARVWPGGCDFGLILALVGMAKVGPDGEDGGTFPLAVAK